MPFSKSFQELFIIPENESEDWDSKVFEYGEAKDIEKLDEHLASAKELYLEEKQIYTAINTFTLDTESNEEKQRLLNQLRNESFILDVDVTDAFVVIELSDHRKIKVCKMSEIIPGLKEEDPEIVTENRKGTCHCKALITSSSLGSIPNDVVTGYIYGLSDKVKYLHSWVELNYHGNDVVLDYTLNALINREGYYLLNHISEPLSRISSKQIQEDCKLIKKLNKVGSFNIKEYLVFRDEIIRDLEKNREVLDKDEI